MSFEEVLKSIEQAIRNEKPGGGVVLPPGISPLQIKPPRQERKDMSMRGELEQKIQELQATVIKLKDQLMELGGIIDHHLDLKPNTKTFDPIERAATVLSSQAAFKSSLDHGSH